MGKENTTIKLEMQSHDVVALYRALDEMGIKIWVDGGWGVDALLGKQTRVHKDLDIAVEEKNVPELRAYLGKHGYEPIKEDSKWNFVLSDSNGHEVDVHSVIFDKNGGVVGGIMYPAGSLTGTGLIDNQEVRCISPKYMVEFLAPWIHKWPEKYADAVSALCKKFSIELPEEYRKFKKVK